MWTCPSPSMSVTDAEVWVEENTIDARYVREAKVTVYSPSFAESWPESSPVSPESVLSVPERVPSDFMAKLVSPRWRLSMVVVHLPRTSKAGLLPELPECPSRL